MGATGSTLAEMEVLDPPIQVQGGWTVHNGFASHNQPVTVLVSQPEKKKKKKSQPLEKYARNLMLVRHPSILRYIDSGELNGANYLVTEPSRPLQLVQSDLTTSQIIAGLHSILEALNFLHEKANVCHNNVCASSVNVSPTGTWKLAGLEFLCKISDATPSYLSKCRSERYEKGIAPEELGEGRCDAISRDAFSFGIFAKEVLNHSSTTDIPGVQDFISKVINKLLSSDPEQRPSLNSVMSHAMFQDPYLQVCHFLTNLPLQKEKERQVFFSTLSEKLFELSEQIVGQMVPMLLGRMVLLDPTARTHFLPSLFKPAGPVRRDLYKPEQVNPLLCDDAYTDFLLPEILRIFPVRDAQVRIVLLNNFPSFCHLFKKEELQEIVLPQLLLGIKDSNNSLVAATLHALAELVPLLGAQVVIGGKPKKLFADGKPKVSLNASSPTKRGALNREKRLEEQRLKREARLKQKQLEVKLAATEETPIPVEELPERRSPDGGEGLDTVITSNEEGDWSDWDELSRSNSVNSVDVAEVDTPVTSVPDNNSTLLGTSAALSRVVESTHLNMAAAQTGRLQLSGNAKKKVVSQKVEQVPGSDLDILDLEINVTAALEEDFFSNMVPEFTKPLTYNVSDSVVLEPELTKPTVETDIEDRSKVGVISSKFGVSTSEDVDEAWGDDLDWGPDI